MSTTQETAKTSVQTLGIKSMRLVVINNRQRAMPLRSLRVQVGLERAKVPTRGLQDLEG